MSIRKTFSLTVFLVFPLALLLICRERIYFECALHRIHITKDGLPVQPESLGHPEGIADERNYLSLLFLTRYWPRFARKQNP